MPDKLPIYQACVLYVKGRRKTIDKALKSIQDGLQKETKRTAGDKHETGRAMLQLEEEKLNGQLLEISKLEQLMNQINPAERSEKIGLGSLVRTDKGDFYISVSAGKLMVSGKFIQAISLASPIGKAMQGLSARSAFELNGHNYIIQSVG